MKFTERLGVDVAVVIMIILMACFSYHFYHIKTGKKIDDYWEAGKTGLLTDAKVFISSLFSFDKENIPDRVIKAIAPYMDDPAFTPQAIEKVPLLLLLLLL